MPSLHLTYVLTWTTGDKNTNKQSVSNIVEIKYTDIGRGWDGIRVVGWLDLFFQTVVAALNVITTTVGAVVRKHHTNQLYL